jgi:glycosyltransferase involved in cell wall biosynthesis
MPAVLKILFVTYQGDLGGSTQSMIYLARGMAARGHEVWFGCRRESRIFGELEHGPVHVTPMEFSRFGGPAAKQITELCRKEGIDIVNAQSSQDRYAALRARLFGRIGARVVFTRRQMPSSSRLSCVLNNIGAHRVIAVSGAVAEALSECGISRRKITVIHNGTPPEKYAGIAEGDVRRWREELGIRPGETVIGCIARRKRQDLLIEATRWLPGDAVILIAGADEQPEWTELVRSLKPVQRIIFLPHTDRVLSLYPLLSVSVLPSMIEGLSQTILESMALGVPMVASRWGGNPEIIEHGISGLLFDPTDSRDLAVQVNRVLNEPELAARFVERGKQRALVDFNVENTVRRTEKCFCELLNR